MKKFISGILVGTILATAVGSFASGFWDNIDVLRNDIRVVVNNKEVPANNFLYNDTTYLPLRAISNALNIPVQYDEETNTALIGKITTPTAVPTPRPLDPEKYPIPVVTEDSPEYIVTVDGIYAELKGGQYCVTIATIDQLLKDMGYGDRFRFTYDEQGDTVLYDSENNWEVIFSNIQTIYNYHAYILLEYYYTTMLPWIETL